jgi:hypothetical protein
VALLGYLLLAALLTGAAAFLAVVGAVLAGLLLVLLVVGFLSYCIWDWFKS